MICCNISLVLSLPIKMRRQTRSKAAKAQLKKGQAQAAKGTRRRYNNAAMERAIQDYKSKAKTLRQCAKVYAVPYTTLQNKVNSMYQNENSGRPQLLSTAVEQFLAASIINLAEWGFGVNKDEVIKFVAGYLINTNKTDLFPNGIPGRKWYEGFMKRHPILTKRIAQSLPANRAKAVCYATLQRFYLEQVKPEYIRLQSDMSHMLTARHVWNCDEVGFQCSLGSLYILCRLGVYIFQYFVYFILFQSM
jgi:hypothetical protein